MRRFRDNVIPAAAVVTVLLAVVFVSCQNRQEMRHVRDMTIGDVDPAAIADGDYPGEFTYDKFTYVVMTTIQRGRIGSIDVLTCRNNRHARKAQAVIGNIIEAQTTNVDAITGATTTSKALMKAVENSLTDAPRR
ncbi:MAG: FMN-binding protein [Phycisphaerae bacterium]|nr:FMN-binding protein [Phycisphaerae bacterium]